MTEWNWQEFKVGITVTKDALPPVRMPDPLWRKPLVALGIVKPKYRPGTFSDLIYGDNAKRPREFGGLQDLVKRN